MRFNAFLLYRKLRSYTIKILSYCRAKFFEKQKIAFQKCTWLKKSEFAPHVRRRAERRSRFSCYGNFVLFQFRQKFFQPVKPLFDVFHTCGIGPSHIVGRRKACARNNRNKLVVQKHFGKGVGRVYHLAV